MYNVNKHFHYTRKCISCYTSSRITRKCTMKVYFLLYIVSYNKKYTFLYNENVCCNYISSCIMKIFVVIIREDV